MVIKRLNIKKYKEESSNKNRWYFSTKNKQESSTKDKSETSTIKYAYSSEEREKLMKHLMYLNLQNKIIHFTLTNMLPFDEKMVKANKQDLKI